MNIREHRRDKEQRPADQQANKKAPILGFRNDQLWFIQVLGLNQGMRSAEGMRGSNSDQT